LADGVTCQSANADTVTATVNALPANPTVTAGARCGSGTVTLTASSSDNDVVIDWYETLSDETALASGNDTYTTPSLDAGTTYYTQARNTSTGCISASREAVATAINAPATITTHPVSQTFCEATISPTLTVAATAGSGNTLTYKWKEGATGMDVGSNSSSYTPTVTATTEYWVVVTDNNSCSVTSDKAKIAVSAPVAGEIGTACTGNTGGKIGI
jgi:hypothetical protein